jgi:ethanolamine utilization cobalamin adenosyltransferase
MLDHLHARCVLCEAVALEQGNNDIACEIAKAAKAVRELICAEYTGNRKESLDIEGLTDEQIHKMSHNPKHYFGIDHFIVTGECGELMAKINLLRTEVRNVERYCVKEFSGIRDDIIKCLNRLSSYVYCIMLRLKKEEQL